MKTSEIRSMDLNRLSEELVALEASRVDIAVRTATEEGEGHKLKNLKRDIARFKTIIRERQGQAS